MYDFNQLKTLAAIYGNRVIGGAAVTKSVWHSAENNPFSDWLYGPWDENKYRTYLALQEFPVINRYMDWLLKRRSDQEYLDRHGMTYEDIHNPQKLSASGDPVTGSVLNFVSDNVKRLYH